MDLINLLPALFTVEFSHWIEFSHEGRISNKKTWKSLRKREALQVIQLKVTSLFPSWRSFSHLVPAFSLHICISFLLPCFMALISCLTHSFNGETPIDLTTPSSAATGTSAPVMQRLLLLQLEKKSRWSMLGLHTILELSNESSYEFYMLDIVGVEYTNGSTRISMDVYQYIH